MTVVNYATDVVHYHSGRRPDAPAIEDIGTGEVLTWQDFEHKVAGTAGVLADVFGVGKGDRVAVLSYNNPWMLHVHFACMRLGAIFVPLNFRLSRAELQFVCADADPVVVIHDAMWAEVAADVAAAGHVRRASFGVADTPYDIVSGCQLVEPRTARLIADITDPVSLVYTSGTTGRPKGAICTHQTLHYQTLNSLDAYDLSVDCRYLAAAPFFHAAGLNSMTFPLLALGGTVAVTATFDPVQAVALLSDRDRGFTHFTGPPVMYQMLAAVPAFVDADFSHMRHGQVGGGFLERDITKAFHDRGWPLSPAYGSSEMGPIVSVVPPSESLTKFGSCGVPVQYASLRIVGTDGQDVAVGEAGEVWAHGPSIAPGYWGRDRATDPSYEGEWFRTGDIAVQDKDGFLTIVDRFKDMYKSGGENVYPAEVERVLHEHPDVADSAVIPVPHPRWGEVGRALIVPRTGATLDAQSIAAHCRQRLAKYKVPAEFVEIEPFERNVTGKLPKAELKKKYGTGESTVAPRETPAADQQ